LGVLNNRSLESIDNPRLVRLKEKTLGWRFRIIHIPGRKLVGPDALSRAVAPSPEEMQMLVYCHEMSEQYTPVPGTKFPGWGVIEQQGDEMSTKEAREGILGAIRTVMGGQYTLPDPEMDASECMLASMELGIKSVSWEMVKAELSKDAEFKDLADWIEGGCRGLPEDLPLYLKQYWRVKNKLRLVESVPMMVDRTVVPVKLRSQVLETLHSAHQGVLSMGLRAEQAVYWPGFWSDIESTRARCSTCDKIAPSQAKLPPVEPLVPNYPFEHICVDYMQLDGHSFRVYVDRYTGWPGMFKGNKAYDMTKFLANLCRD
jgi:hypothetical protein